MKSSELVQVARACYKREMFSPTFLGIFVNPYFLIRRGLVRAITKNARFLSGKMLDFGCGSKPYRQLFDTSVYIGLDITDNVHISPHRDVDVYYDGKTIPFSDSSFDSILASEVFEHVFDLDPVLLELRRVLKDDGKLLLTIPFVWEEHEIPFDFGRYSSFGMRHILEKNGFTVIHIEKATSHVETIFQMINTYVTNVFALKIKWMRLVLTSLFTFPFTILGILFSKFFPARWSLYSNLVAVAEKKGSLP